MALNECNPNIIRALSQNEITRPLLDTSYKFIERKKDAIYISIDDINQFSGAYLMKGLLRWNVRYNLNFNNFDHQVKESDRITSLIFNIEKSALIFLWYDWGNFDIINVNNQQIKAFKMSTSNKALGFILENKETVKIVEGYDFQGRLTYKKELTEAGIDIHDLQ